MKYSIAKFASLILCFCMIFLASCSESETDIEDSGEELSAESLDLGADTEKPVIKIPKSTQTVKIKKGEQYDLMSGVSGRDDRDGVITDKIQVNKGGFDPCIPGEYTVTYFLADKAGNSADPKTRKIIVMETEPIKPYDIWDKDIDNEILNPSVPEKFGGAWYHKVVSSRDNWIGIEATVTLPQVKITRYDGEYNEALDVDPDSVNLDNPSVYLGGNATNESDVGLSYSRALVDISNKTLSKGCIAFRPFWRYITDKDRDVGDYSEHLGEYAVSANGDNCIANYHWKYTQYYYLPGDVLRIIIHIPSENKMQMQIEVIKQSEIPSSVEMRKNYGWNDPADFISPVFTSPGHGTGIKAEYKRVNAIDQVNNEGGTAINTDSVISNAVWHNTYLYREINGVRYRVPMNESRRACVNSPDEKAFTVTSIDKDSENGGETVSIHPSTVK